MTNIVFRDITKDNADDVINGFIHAFPHWKHKDAKALVLEQLMDDELEYIGAYSDNHHAGLSVTGDIFHNFRGSIIPAIELDHLHTDLLHKKQGISTHLLKEVSHRSLNRDCAIMFLGPFSTKFYRNKGFGYALRMLSFEAKPIDFRDYGSTKGLEYYNPKNENDKNALRGFIYNTKLALDGNISMKKNSLDSYISTKLDDKERVTLLCKSDSNIQGYLTYKNSNEITIDEILYTTPTALKALSTYIHRQNGQSTKVKVECCDEAVLFSCDRPQNIRYEEIFMAKILDVDMFFTSLQKYKSINFNNQTLSLKVITTDGLYKTTNQVTLHFKDGKIIGIDNKDADVTIETDIAEFSSLVIGRVSFKDLLRCGLATVNNKRFIDIIDSIFHTHYTPLMYQK